MGFGRRWPSESHEEGTKVAKKGYSEVRLLCASPDVKCRLAYTTSRQMSVQPAPCHLSEKEVITRHALSRRRPATLDQRNAVRFSGRPRQLRINHGVMGRGGPARWIRWRPCVFRVRCTLFGSPSNYFLKYNPQECYFWHSGRASIGLSYKSIGTMSEKCFA